MIFPQIVSANIGVGVGTGKIQIDEKLAPGTIYELPPLTVLNTGDEPGDYEVGISYLEKQPELRPALSWFIFSPQKFQLDPGKAQIVSIKLNLPVRTEPGNYFALVEGFPSKKASNGNTTVGVAAAAKLYFTVEPANVLVGIYYKIISFWKVYAPWPQRISVFVGIVLVIAFLKSQLNIKIDLKRSNRVNEEPDKDE